MRTLTRLGRSRLSVKILLVLGSVIAAMTAMTASVAYNGIDDLTRQAGNERIEEEVLVAQAQIATVERQLVRDTRYLAQNLAASQAVRAGDIPAIQTNLLLNEATAQSAIDHVLVVDDARDPLVKIENSKITLVPDTLPDELLSFALLGIPVSGVARGDEPLLVAAAPIQTNTGEIVGAVQVGLRLDDDFLGDINFERAGVHLILLDRVGGIVAVFIEEFHHSIGDVEALLSGNDFAESASPAEKLNNFGITMNSVAIQGSLSGEVVYESDFIHNAEGRTFIAAYIPYLVNYEVEGVLVVLVDLNTLSSVGDDLIARQLFALVLIGLVSALVLALLAWYLIARPLEKLQHATLKLASGDYLHRADIHSSDEVGRLAAAFNAMACALQERGQQIASEIEERTKIEQALMAFAEKYEF